MINKSTYLRTFSIALICLISLPELTAQDIGIYEVSNKQGKNDNVKGNNNRNRFYDLVLNLQPTHYINDNKLKTTYDSADNPIKMTFEDSKSFEWLKNENSKKDNLELLVINLINSNDLNNTIDISKDKNFKNLKYVFIRCNFKCSENDILQFIQTDSKVRIFYSNEIGG